MKALCGSVVVTGLSVAVCAAQMPSGTTPPDWQPERIAAEGLPNALRVHARVISGGAPDGERAFAELQKLGVRTVISVDGARPNIELASKYGMRYVHLPHGYDGIPEDRVKELAKAVRDLPGPVYVHCHHGKHRSPAAATVACVAAGMLDPERSLAVLKSAGTSSSYRGLYQSAASTRRLDDVVLANVATQFPAIAQVPPMADAMVLIEHTHDHLKAMAAAGWKRLADKPDLEPAHEALLLKEHYHELRRTPEAARQAAGFRELLAGAEKNAERLETELRTGRVQKATSTFAAVTQDCTKCHTQFRDIPLGEKSQ